MQNGLRNWSANYVAQIVAWANEKPPVASPIHGPIPDFRRLGSPDLAQNVRKICGVGRQSAKLGVLAKR